MKTLQNFYKATILQSAGSGTGILYVSVKPTPTSGWLVISPANATLREIIEYNNTGTDSNGDYVVANVRGVGGTTAQSHAVNEPIRMNITAEHMAEIASELGIPQDYLDTDPTLSANSDVKVPSQKAIKKYADDLAIAGSPVATTTNPGISYLSAAPSGSSIAVSETDTRLPSQDENDALAGNSPSGSNKYITANDTGTTVTASLIVKRKVTTGGIAVPATPTDSEDAASKGYVDGGYFKAMTASDTLKWSADTERVGTGVLKRIDINKNYGSVRISFDGKKTSGYGTVTFRIYKSSAVGTTRSLSTSYQTWTEDFSGVVEHDYFTLVGGSDGSAVPICRNFRILYDLSDGVDVTVTTD